MKNIRNFEAIVDSSDLKAEKQDSMLLRLKKTLWKKGDTVTVEVLRMYARMSCVKCYPSCSLHCMTSGAFATVYLHLCFDLCEKFLKLAIFPQACELWLGFLHKFLHALVKICGPSHAHAQRQELEINKMTQADV